MTSREPRFATIVHWQHRRGGPAHCLARLFSSASGQPVAILSEVRSNPEGYGITGDFAAAAEAMLRLMPATIDPAAVRWLAHHGDFSYPDAGGAPETFTEVELVWDGQYHDELSRHRRLDPAQTAALQAQFRLEPVLDVVARLQRESGS